jgi:ABC-2 type transport system ATP-binding protein
MTEPMRRSSEVTSADLTRSICGGGLGFEAGDLVLGEFSISGSSPAAMAFGEKVAVEGLDLTSRGLAARASSGPNGAGKTTTIRMIMSILFPIRASSPCWAAVRRRDQGPHRLPARGTRRLQEDEGRRVPDVHGGAQGRLRRRGIAASTSGWSRSSCRRLKAKRCEELSKGMQQKVQFIATCIHEPELMILDEPFSGLDPVNMRLLRDLIREQHRGARRSSSRRTS